MSLNIYLEKTQPTIVAQQSITHNVIPMAKLCGVYDAVWRGDENGITTSKQLIPILIKGIDFAHAHYGELFKLNPTNKWGDVDGFIAFIKELLKNCEVYPDATLTFSR